MSLISHAKEELQRAGLFDEDSDYNGMIGKAVMEIIETFSKQGHSGFSAAQCSYIFNILSSYKTLSPITTDSSEWQDVSSFNPNGKKMWQNKRDPSYFSHDGGKHFYCLNEKPKWKYKLRRLWCEVISSLKY